MKAQQDSQRFARVKLNYEIEKELANRLKSSSRDERKRLYATVYDEFSQRVPSYTERFQQRAAQETATIESPQWRFLRRFLHKETLFLEIGAGAGAISLTSAKFVKRVYAQEVSEEIIQKAKGPENLEVILFDGLSISPLPECVNVAYSDQVMEHIHPDDALEQLISIYKALAPGGIYICITPNKLNGPHDISRHFDLVATGFHLKEYTNTELSKLFKQAGFSKVNVYIGAAGYYLRWPLFCLSLQEWLLGSLPRRLSRAIARVSLPWGIRLVGIKR